MKKKIFYFSYKFQNGNCYWGFGIDFNVVKAMINIFTKKLILFIKKLIFAGQYLLNHVFDLIYILCFLGIMIFASEFAEGHNKGGNLIATIICAGFIYGIFILNKKWKQKIVA